MMTEQEVMFAARRTLKAEWLPKQRRWVVRNVDAAHKACGSDPRDYETSPYHTLVGDTIHKVHVELLLFAEQRDRAEGRR